MSPSWRTMPPITCTLNRAIAPERLADRSVRLEKQLFDRLAVLEPLLELVRLRAQLRVGELLELGLQREDVLGLVRESLQPPAFADAQDLLEIAQGRRHSPLE